MERSKRNKKKKKDLLGSHQRAWVWGRRPVLEILKSTNWPPIEVFLDETMDANELDKAVNLAKKVSHTIKVIPPSRLFNLCHSREHQGYLVKMPDFPYSDETIVLDLVKSKTTDAPLFVILDSIQDPHNFGAIVRTAEALGVDAIIIGKRNQTPVTSMSVRSSAGAVCNIPIIKTDDLAAFTEKVREAGVQVVGASERAECDADQFNFSGPIALVMGNEGTGLSDKLIKLCDKFVSIPHSGKTASLNVSAAAAILIYIAKTGNKKSIR